jgi:ketosteroid isomerase-like protein
MLSHWNFLSEVKNDLHKENGPAQPDRRKVFIGGLGLAATSLLSCLPTGAHAPPAGPPSSTRGHEARTRMSPNRAILERYYSALQHKNADELQSAIEEGFAADAVLRISDSLPYGGTYTGRKVILTMLMGFVTTTTPIIRPEQIKIERVVEEGESIVAKAVFPWLAPGAREPIPMSAFEWFTFRDGRVSEMVVSYWDTAACLAAMRAAAAKP